MADPERDAVRLLHVAWTDPFGEVIIPVDPVKIANDLGIDVFTAPMDAHISGTLTKKSGSDAVIYLNKADHPNRQRFTCAHELGHYISRTSTGTFDYEFVDRRDELASLGRNPDEIYANRFAASLLMPADVVLRLRKDLEPFELAYRFKVSEEAMSFRLANIRGR